MASESNSSQPRRSSLTRRCRWLREPLLSRRPPLTIAFSASSSSHDQYRTPSRLCTSAILYTASILLMNFHDLKRPVREGLSKDSKEQEEGAARRV